MNILCKYIYIYIFIYLYKMPSSTSTYPDRPGSITRLLLNVRPVVRHTEGYWANARAQPPTRRVT